MDIELIGVEDNKAFVSIEGEEIILTLELDREEVQTLLEVLRTIRAISGWR